MQLKNAYLLFYFVSYTFIYINFDEFNFSTSNYILVRIGVFVDIKCMKSFAHLGYFKSFMLLLINSKVGELAEDLIFKRLAGRKLVTKQFSNSLRRTKVKGINLHRRVLCAHRNASNFVHGIL